jgi:hypothetical protein
LPHPLCVICAKLDHILSGHIAPLTATRQLP